MEVRQGVFVVVDVDVASASANQRVHIVGTAPQNLVEVVNSPLKLIRGGVRHGTLVICIHVVWISANGRCECIHGILGRTATRLANALLVARINLGPGCYWTRR